MIDAAAYVSERQGRPYSETEHCWRLVEHTQRDLFGEELPSVDLAGMDLRALAKAFHGHPERQRWVQVARPTHGAIVLMHRPGAFARAIHAGVYLDLDGGGVFHTDEHHGVCFDTLLEIALRNWRAEFYVRP